MKKIIFLWLFGGISVLGYTQEVIVLEKKLDEMNKMLQTQLTLINKTNFSNSSANLASKLLSADNLALVQKGMDLVSKVSNVIKASNEVKEIYNTEERILKKVQKLSSQYGEFGNGSLLNDTKFKVLETTARMMNNFTQLTTDDIYVMNDKERMDAIKEVHRGLLTIESIIDGRYHKKIVTEKGMQKLEEDAKVIDDYQRVLQEKRRKIDQL
ncbi:hypothetical protein [Capnocytophaga canis]|uniref:hypothetical protein n=1 Tax=Capnocytophaga canis TaxID=1848903 RepID=UPI0037D3A6D9